MAKKRFINIFSILALVFSLVLPVSTISAEEDVSVEGFTLNVMHINDTHARVEKFPELITAIKDYRAQHEDALLLHGGDAFSGTLYFNQFKGQADLELFNLMDIDAMVFGNHEFDVPNGDGFHEDLAEFVKGANFPFVGTNVDFSNDTFMAPLVSSEPFTEHVQGGEVYDGIILEVNGEKVGIFGLTTEDTKNIASPVNVTFENYIEAAKRAVKEFESRGVNKIIAVNHIGYNTGTPEIGNDLLLAQNVAGIDIIVGGHSHTQLDEPVVVDKLADGTDKDPTVIVQANEYANFLGTLEVVFDDQGAVIGFSGELLETENYEADEEALKILAPYKQKVEEFANKKINAKAMKDLENPRATEEDPFSVRANETALGNLITDAMLAGAKKKFPETVIAFQNGGGIRAPIAKGEITIGDVISVLPFGNDPVIVTLTGAELKEIFERSVSSVPNEFGGFLHVSGMKFEFDSRMEPGNRIQAMYVNMNGEWEEITADGEYMVTTNGFTGRGGDGYEVLEDAYKAGRVTDIGEIDWQQLVTYMEEDLEGIVDPEIEGRIIDLAFVEEEVEDEEETDTPPAEEGSENEEEVGKELPKTATPMYTYLFIGSLLLLASVIMLAYRRYAFIKNE